MSRGDKISMCYTKDLILIELIKNTTPENFAVLSLSFYYERNSGTRIFFVFVLNSTML